MSERLFDLVETAIDYCQKLEEFPIMHSSFIEFINNQESCRLLWLKSEDNCAKFESEVTLLNSKIVRKENQIQCINSDLVTLKSENIILHEKNHKYEQQLNEIQTLLNDNELLSVDMRNLLYNLKNKNDADNFSLASNSYVVDDSHIRMSNTFTEQPIYRKSLVPSDNDDTSQESNEPECVPQINKVLKRATLNNNTLNQNERKIPNFDGGTKVEIRNNKLPMPEMVASKKVKYNDYTSYSDIPHFNIIDRTEHYFVRETITSKNIDCDYCNKRVSTKDLPFKCDYCNIIVHKKCKETNKIKCEMAVVSLKECSMGRVPKVPRLVKHLILEIEKRGLNEPGLYRLSGHDREVKEILENYLKHGVINFNKVYDIHVLSCVLKRFLMRLDDPLIPFSKRDAFVSAANSRNAAEIRSLIANLAPESNQTLASIILHLKKVIQSKSCVMDVSNVGRIFAPTLVSTPPENKDKDIYIELFNSRRVVEEILLIENSFFIKILEDSITEHVLYEEGRTLTPKPITKTSGFENVKPFSGMCPMTVDSALRKKGHHGGKKTKMIHLFGRKKKE